MKLLGITGGIGAGKSSVTRLFASMGATVVDADAISRQVMMPGGTAYDDVVFAFGQEILDQDGKINRKKLASLVFTDSKQRKKLNTITHTAVFHEMKKQIQEAETELVCLDVPLLFDSDFPFVCDYTLAVIAPRELRIKRVMERDGMTREQVLARMNAQLTDGDLMKKADLCVHNVGTEQELKEKVTELFHRIME